MSDGGITGESMKHTDPINKQCIPVKSVYIPSKTLLQGRPYTRTNGVLVNSLLPKKGNNDK